MTKLSDKLLSNPIKLLKWGYEFPILTDTEFSFNVRTKTYKGRVIIQKEANGFSISLENKRTAMRYNSPNQVIEALDAMFVEPSDTVLPF